MPFYEYEHIVKNLINILKEKKEAEEGSTRDQSQTDLMKSASKYLPKGFNPNNPMSSVKMPSFPSIPSSMKI